MRLHLIDGTYELFRAHFSKRPPHAAPDGQDLKGTVGLASSLLSLLRNRKEAVTHIAVAFDNPIRCFRNDLFDGYKTEEGVPPELLAQFDCAEEAVAALGIVVWSMDLYEADDAMATAAARWRAVVKQVRIMSPDKDMGQCIRGRRVVQVDRRRETMLDREGLIALRGIRPESIPDFLALVGDAADGIPGIPGFGERTASALLAKYRHLEAIPQNHARWPAAIHGAPRLAAMLVKMREEAKLYRKLATLEEAVPLKETLEGLRWGGVPRAKFEAWCDRLDVGALRTRPTRWAD